MNGSTGQKRPWLAALLGVLITGLGHLYLRRWWRALAWVLAAFATAFLVLDPEVLALSPTEPVDVRLVWPILGVVALSAVDAYLVAKLDNSIAARQTQPEEPTRSCPNCGRDIEGELDFCTWCGEELEDNTDHEN
ncbi:MAG: DUF7575 domain-containing protein [Halodesulfurarchaeum sp.]